MMTRKEISDFESLHAQLQSFHQELTTLTKKSPNDGLNKFKLGLVNSAIKRANTLLGKSRRPFADFESFDESTLPSNSDVLMIISQYLAAFEKLRGDNAKSAFGSWYWKCSEDDPKTPTIRMAKPLKIID